MACEQVKKPLHEKLLVPGLAHVQSTLEVNWVTCRKGFTGVTCLPLIGISFICSHRVRDRAKYQHRRAEAPEVAAGPLGGSVTADTRTYTGHVGSGKLVRGDHLPGPHSWPTTFTFMSPSLSMNPGCQHPCEKS